MEEPDSATGATVRLGGHARVPARLGVERFPLWAWLARNVLLCAAWLIGTLATLVLTFDPFVATFPGVIGGAMLYRGIRARYRVRSFEGACPRCGGALRLAAGSRIALPHRFDCYGCHFAPELHVDG